MAEKLESNEVTLSPAGTVALAEGELLVEVPQAASTMAIAPANPMTVNDLSLRNYFSLLMFRAGRETNATSQTRSQQRDILRLAG
jgi:hypothetical protein